MQKHALDSACCRVASPKPHIMSSALQRSLHSSKPVEYFAGWYFTKEGEKPAKLQIQFDMDMPGKFACGLSDADRAVLEGLRVGAAQPQTHAVISISVPLVSLDHLIHGDVDVACLDVFPGRTLLHRLLVNRGPVDTRTHGIKHKVMLFSQRAELTGTLDDRLHISLPGFVLTLTRRSGHGRRPILKDRHKPWMIRQDGYGVVRHGEGTFELSGIFSVLLADTLRTWQQHGQGPLLHLPRFVGATMTAPPPPAAHLPVVPPVAAPPHAVVAASSEPVAEPQWACSGCTLLNDSSATPRLDRCRLCNTARNSDLVTGSMQREQAEVRARAGMITRYFQT